MRVLLFLAALAAAAAVACDASAAGAYASIAARDPAACARLCADDSLCIAWSFGAEGNCELRATAPSNPTGLAYGHSARAPAALRQLSFTEQAPPVAAPEESAAAARPEDDVSRLLLGGLEEDETGLRQ